MMSLKRVRLAIVILIFGFFVIDVLLLLASNGYIFPSKKKDSDAMIPDSYTVLTQSRSDSRGSGLVTRDKTIRQRITSMKTSKSFDISNDKEAAANKSETSSPNRRIKYLSIYTRHMGPFRAWREYAILEAAFAEARNDSRSHYGNKIIPTLFIGCPDYECDVALRPTVDEHLLEQSDAILLNFAPSMFRNKMFKISERLTDTLPRNIRVFFYAMESPLMMSYWDQTIQDVQYHYDITYHSESDVYFPYGRYVPEEPIDTKPINYAENKTKLLVWVASNCNNTFWPRTDWVRKLEKLIDIDTYGECGKKTCLPPMSAECTRQQSVYKFNLAFENAPCDEYISEKFWVNSLMSGLVPIVYGGRRAAYERVAPPNSFIHVGDFGSQQKLVDYLNMINKNESLYNKFFAWRRQGHVEKIYPQLNPDAFCRVLPKISEDTSPTMPTVKRIGDSKYFQGCQGGSQRDFVSLGDIKNWSPWR